MKPYRSDTGSVGWFSFFGQSLLPRLYALAIAALLLLPIGAAPALAVQNSASAASTAHVYLLRGVLNIFSLGLDDIAADCGRRAFRSLSRTSPHGLRSPTKPPPDTRAARSKRLFWSGILRERLHCPTWSPGWTSLALP